MNYEKLSREEFDAIVTGELTHYAIWLEGEIINILADYFVGDSERRENFITLLLRRDGLSFQDKIEILRAMTPIFGQVAIDEDLRGILQQVEELKSFRNAFAHGLDSSTDQSHTISVEVVGRSGKPKVVTVTPDSHRAVMEKAEQLMSKLKTFRSRIAPNHSMHSDGAASGPAGDAGR